MTVYSWKCSVSQTCGIVQAYCVPLIICISTLHIDALATPKLQVTSATGVTLNLEWSPVRGASYYTLIVREDTSSRPPREVLTIYDEVATVTDLKPATRYCAVLSAKNSVTQSAYSQPVCVTTGVPM